MNWSCVICQELLTHHPEEPNRRPDPPEVVVIQCGHLFHRTCIERWFAESFDRYDANGGLVRDCPFCKQSCPNDLTKIYPVTSDDGSSIAATRPGQGEGVSEVEKQVQSIRNEMIQCQGLMEDIGADLEHQKWILEQQLIEVSVQSLPRAGAIISNPRNQGQLPNSSTRQPFIFGRRGLH